MILTVARRGVPTHDGGQRPGRVFSLQSGPPCTRMFNPDSFKPEFFWGLVSDNKEIFLLSEEIFIAEYSYLCYR